MSAAALLGGATWLQLVISIHPAGSEWSFGSAGISQWERSSAWPKRVMWPRSLFSPIINFSATEEKIWVSTRRGFEEPLDSRAVLASHHHKQNAKKKKVLPFVCDYCDAMFLFCRSSASHCWCENAKFEQLCSTYHDSSFGFIKSFWATVAQRNAATVLWLCTRHPITRKRARRKHTGPSVMLNNFGLWSDALFCFYIVRGQEVSFLLFLDN